MEVLQDVPNHYPKMARESHFSALECFADLKVSSPVILKVILSMLIFDRLTGLLTNKEDRINTWDRF